MELKDQLRQLRKLAKLTQGELGERLKVPQSTISKRERGEVELRVQDIVDTADVCGLRAVITFMPVDLTEDVSELLEQADPRHRLVLIRLLQALPRLEPRERELLLAMIELGASRGLQGS